MIEITSMDGKKKQVDMPDRNRRLLYIIETEEGGNVTKFANNLVGYTQQAINRLLKIDSRSGVYPNVSERLASAISKAYPAYNALWILHGDVVGNGKSYDNEQMDDVIEVSDEDSYNKAVSQGLRLIPEHVAAFRGGNGGALLSRDDIVGYWHIPGARGTDIITVDGDSMAPVYPSGTRVLIRPFGFSIDNPNGIPFGNPFAVEVEDEFSGERIGYVKYIRRHRDPELAKKYWIAHSADSDHFDDFDIPIKQVRGLWIIEYALRKVF